MKSRIVLTLTPAQARTLRAGIRTAQEEDCGPAVWREYDELLRKLADAPKVNAASVRALAKAFN